MELKNNLAHKAVLEKDMTLYIPEGEWHVFKNEEGGSHEILFIYGSKVLYTEEFHHDR